MSSRHSAKPYERTPLARASTLPSLHSPSDAAQPGASVDDFIRQGRARRREHAADGSASEGWLGMIKGFVAPLLSYVSGAQDHYERAHSPTHRSSPARNHRSPSGTMEDNQLDEDGDDEEYAPVRVEQPVFQSMSWTTAPSHPSAPTPAPMQRQQQSSFAAAAALATPFQSAAAATPFSSAAAASFAPATPFGAPPATPLTPHALASLSRTDKAALFQALKHDLADENQHMEGEEKENGSTGNGAMFPYTLSSAAAGAASAQTTRKRTARSWESEEAALAPSGAGLRDFTPRKQGLLFSPHARKSLVASMPGSALTTVSQSIVPVSAQLATPRSSASGGATGSAAASRILATLDRLSTPLLDARQIRTLMPSPQPILASQAGLGLSFAPSSSRRTRDGAPQPLRGRFDPSRKAAVRGVERGKEPAAPAEDKRLPTRSAFTINVIPAAARDESKEATKKAESVPKKRRGSFGAAVQEAEADEGDADEDGRPTRSSFASSGSSAFGGFEPMPAIAVESSKHPASSAAFKVPERTPAVSAFSVGAVSPQKKAVLSPKLATAASPLRSAAAPSFSLAPSAADDNKNKVKETTSVAGFSFGADVSKASSLLKLAEPKNAVSVGSAPSFSQTSTTDAASTKSAAPPTFGFSAVEAKPPTKASPVVAPVKKPSPPPPPQGDCSVCGMGLDDVDHSECQAELNGGEAADGEADEGEDAKKEAPGKSVTFNPFASFAPSSSSVPSFGAPSATSAAATSSSIESGFSFNPLKSDTPSIFAATTSSPMKTVSATAASVPAVGSFSFGAVGASKESSAKSAAPSTALVPVKKASAPPPPQGDCSVCGMGLDDVDHSECQAELNGSSGDKDDDKDDEDEGGKKPPPPNPFAGPAMPASFSTPFAAFATAPFDSTFNSKPAASAAAAPSFGAATSASTTVPSFGFTASTAASTSSSAAVTGFSFTSPATTSPVKNADAPATTGFSFSTNFGASSVAASTDSAASTGFSFAAPSGGFSMGVATPSTKASSSSTAAPAASSSALPSFGAPPTLAATPSFGAPSTASAPSFGSAAAPSFGATAAVPSFGASTASTPSFGTSSPAVPSFVAAAAVQSFGATPSVPSFGAAPSATGPSFGAAAAPSFGAPTTPAASVPSFGVTASMPTSSPPFPQQSSLSFAVSHPPKPAFGAASTPAPASSVAPSFGLTVPVANSSPFGATQNFNSPFGSQASAATPSPFGLAGGGGSTTPSGGFGTPQNTTGGSFGFPQHNAVSCSQFGATPAPSFGNLPPAQPTFASKASASYGAQQFGAAQPSSLPFGAGASGAFMSQAAPQAAAPSFGGASSFAQPSFGGAPPAQPQLQSSNSFTTPSTGGFAVGERKIISVRRKTKT